MKQIGYVFTLLFFTLLQSSAHAKETIFITSNQVYAEVERIEADVAAILKHRKLTSVAKTKIFHVKFKPRHVWQKTYEILIKINILRRQDNYPTIAVTTLEPTLNLHPKMVFDQTQRILTELGLIKVRLNLLQSQPTPAARRFSGKTPNDVYALLDKVSADMDVINGFGFKSSDVFAEVVRVNSDIDVILYALSISDRSFPPIKNGKDASKYGFEAGMNLLKIMAKLQRRLVLEETDFSSLGHHAIEPADVFSLVGLISSELQPIKHKLLLRAERTPFSKEYHNKTPADVEQLLGWCTNRLQQASGAGL